MNRPQRLTLGLGIFGLGICSLVHAADPTGPATPQKLEVSKTENFDFPSAGTLHLKNSVGELTIESWDRPGLEITTIKSSKVAVEGPERDKAAKLLDSVKIATERKGDEVTVSTEFPKHRKIARPFKGMTDFDLEYRIKVPRNARLTIDHTMGEVHIDNIAGEIHATDEMGLITIRVPDGAYAIDAMSKLGAVDSDFPGSEKTRKWFGHTFVGSTPAAPQKLFLRIKYGDIILLRMHQPSPPAPVVGK
jgi:hypothetical protein